MLSDFSIEREHKYGGLGINPYCRTQLQPASYDVTLGTTDLGDTCILTPGSFTLGCTLETIAIPNHLAAIIDGKSTLGRLGLSIHQTAGYIDPGFEGQITLELSYAGRNAITLTRGMRIGQLRFFRVDGTVRRPYGHPDLGSHYQHQTGPTPARTQP